MGIGEISIGDVVRWDDGRMQYGEVRGKEAGRLMVVYLTRLDMRPVPVKARFITGHWRKSGATKRRESARLGEPVGA